MNQDSHKGSGWCGVLEVTGPHKELRGILRALPAYPTCRAVEAGFLAPKSLPTVGRLLATATQAAHQTDGTVQEWHTPFLAVILVASLHLLDVLLVWHASKQQATCQMPLQTVRVLPMACKGAKSVWQNAAVAKVSVTSSLQRNQRGNRQPGFTAGSRYRLPGCTTLWRLLKQSYVT